MPEQLSPSERAFGAARGWRRCTGRGASKAERRAVGEYTLQARYETVRNLSYVQCSNVVTGVSHKCVC